MEIRELAFRATLQLQIRTPKSEVTVLPDGNRIIDSSNVWGYGSGFLMLYKNRIFLVTADHNVHPDDHDVNNMSGQRTGLDYNIDIITNVKGPDISCIIQPIGGFLHYTGFCFDDFDTKSESAEETVLKVFEGFSKGTIDINDESIPLGCRIQNIIDFAVAEIKCPFQVPILSNQVLSKDNTTIVNEGSPKMVLNCDCLEQLKDGTSCVVAGTILNTLKNGETQLHRLNACYNIVYDEKQSNNKEMYFRNDDASLDIKMWAGLSGAPVLREDGMLVGMLVNGPGEKGLLTVIPINRILKGIDYNLQVEGLGI